MYFEENSKSSKNGAKTFLLIVLILLVLGSLVFSVLCLRQLDYEDHISAYKGFAIFIFGLTFFSSLNLTLNCLCLDTRCGIKLIETFNVTKATILDINNKQVSAVQALFCCMTGTTILCYSCTRDMLRTSHYISEAYAWFAAPYFLYDLWSMYVVHNAKQLPSEIKENVKRYKSGFRRFLNYLFKNPMIIGHHLFIGIFGFLVITYLRGGLGDCFFGFIYLMEASTPFVSIRGILSKLGLKTSKLYVINGLIMLASFFIFRVIMFPYVIYLYAQSSNLNYISAIHSLPRNCKISILVLLVPQVYWFLLMLKGAAQMLIDKLSIDVKHKKNSEKIL